MIEKYNEIFSSILTTLRPEKKYSDNFISEVNRVVSWFNVAIRAENIVTECVKGGSVAKGTYLKDDHDIDLFVRFSPEYNDKELPDILEKILKLVSNKLGFKYTRLHGSRDYFQFTYRNMDFEVVPVLKIFNASDAVNVTDASPLHVGYIKKQIHKMPNLADQVRLAKQFCKAIGVYGAESYIKGLSGHSIDLLISFYGSFINFISSTKYWQNKVIIDVDNKLKDPLKNISSAKQKSPIILIDPIDNSRNATAALSKEKYELLKLKAQEFLDNPSKDFFKIEKMNLKKVKQKHIKDWCLFFNVEPLKDKTKDVQGSFILKVKNFIEKELKHHDFQIKESGFDFEHIYIVITKEKLSDYVVHPGPPKRQRKNCQDFIAKHKGRKKVFEKDKRLYLKIKRKYKDPIKLAEQSLKDDYVKSRIKTIKILKRLR